MEWRSDLHALVSPAKTDLQYRNGTLVPSRCVTYSLPEQASDMVERRRVEEAQLHDHVFHYSTDDMRLR